MRASPPAGLQCLAGLRRYLGGVLRLGCVGLLLLRLPGLDVAGDARQRVVHLRWDGLGQVHALHHGVQLHWLREEAQLREHLLLCRGMEAVVLRQRIARLPRGEGLLTRLRARHGEARAGASFITVDTGHGGGAGDLHRPSRGVAELLGLPVGGFPRGLGLPRLRGGLRRSGGARADGRAATVAARNILRHQSCLLSRAAHSYYCALI